MRPHGLRVNEERGASLLLVAVALAAILGVTAFAIDIGMLLTARTEAQRSADAAAHAGAVEWWNSGGDEAATRSTAQTVAGENLVIAEPPQVLDEDVEILTDEDKVRVTVWRTTDRGNPIPTYFAGIMGFDELDVAAMAAARVSSASGAGCPLPLVLIDEWVDNDNDQMWDPDIDTYIPYPDEGYTGYDTEDIGLQIEIKDVEQNTEQGPPMCADTDMYEPCNAFGDPSWDCWWREALPNQGGGGGVDELSPRIRSCVPEGMEIGDTIWSASGAGNKQSLVDDFVWLIEQDPEAFWDEGDNCPKRGSSPGCITSSDRLRSVPLVDPSTVQPDGGANTSAVISNWTGLFIEKVSCSPNVPHLGGPRGRWNVYVRLATMSGTGGGGRPNSLLTSIQIVE